MESGGGGGGEGAGRMVFGRSKSPSSTPSPAAAASAVAAACSELRAAYHECFNRWYAEKFAKGQWHKDDCVGEWHKYRACLEVNLNHPRVLSRLRLSHGSPSLLASIRSLNCYVR